MTRLKSMDDTNHVFTVTIADGQLVLSVPVAAIDNHDDFGTWVGENCDRLNEVYRTAVINEEIVAVTISQPSAVNSDRQ